MFISTSVLGQEVFGQDVNSTLQPILMEYKDLPEPVRKVLEMEEYASWKLEKVYKVGPRKAEREEQYTIRLRNDTEFKDVYLDGEGNVFDPQDEGDKSKSSGEDY